MVVRPLTSPRVRNIEESRSRDGHDTFKNKHGVTVTGLSRDLPPFWLLKTP